MTKIFLLIVFALCFSVPAFARKADALSDRIVKALTQKLPGWKLAAHPRIMSGGVTSEPQFDLTIKDNKNRSVSVSVDLVEKAGTKEMRFENYFRRAIMPPDSSTLGNFVEKGFMVGTANSIDALFSKANLMVSIDAQFPSLPKYRKVPAYYYPAPAAEKAWVLKIIELIAQTIDGDAEIEECRNTFFRYPTAAGETAENKLLTAIASGDADEVSNLLRQNVSPNARISKNMDFASLSHSEGETALHFAARQGCGTSLRALLEARADVNAVNARGETPLMFAAYHNNAEAARLLIAADADVKLESYNHNAAFFAVKAMQVINAYSVKTEARIQKMTENARSILSALDAEGLDLKKKEGWSGNTLLTALLSSTRGSFTAGMTETLLEYGVDPNEPNQKGDTPLLILANSISHDSAGLMKQLIAKGADVNKPGKDSRTPLRVLLNRQAEYANSEYAKHINEAIAVLVNAGAKE